MPSLPVLLLPPSSSESDVEQAFIHPLLTSDTYLRVPADAIKTQENISVLMIDKGDHKRRYRPDYIIYSDAIPVCIIEAKAPLQSVSEGFREAQLYAAEVNKQFREGVNPAELIIATNGSQIALGRWDSNTALTLNVRDLLPSASDTARLRAEYGWDAIQLRAGEIIKKLYPQNNYFPYEALGENRVRLAKVANNTFSEELAPLLQRYFEDTSPEFEDEIIEKGYVSSDETTRYERLFENYLRDRIAPLDDRQAQILEPQKRSESKLTQKLQNADKFRELPGYLQLIIGAVGAGKSTFLRRYFKFLMPQEMAENTIYIYFDFNHADLTDPKRWVCETFIATVSEKYGKKLDLEDPDKLKAVFSKEIRDKSGAYKLLRQASESLYVERLANDILGWMNDPAVYARALARHLGGDRGLSLVFAFDNVDRRDRETQLSIFQTAQWFKNHTKSFCIICLRDTTFETYKAEPPLDTFIKSSNFYIQPPRFVDMVRRRLDLGINSLISEADTVLEYHIEGLGIVRYPKTNLGEYLNAIYEDLFRRKRKITIILEGLAGRSARKALEMFAAVLKSGHLDPKEFTASFLTGGAKRIPEAHLIKSLMRTDYLYFFDSHGFVHNIYDFPPGLRVPNHMLKFEILEFLIENRKKLGDARAEGFFSVGFLLSRFEQMGFPSQDVVEVLKVLFLQNLVIADHTNATELVSSDLVRVHASGFIHARVLSSRVDYIAACALATPMFDPHLADKIGRLWHISEGYTDIRHRHKIEIVSDFLKYLQSYAGAMLPSDDVRRPLFIGTSTMLMKAQESLGIETKSADRGASDEIVQGFQRLFSE